MRLRPGALHPAGARARDDRGHHRPLPARAGAARDDDPGGRAMTEAILEASGLRKVYGDVVAVDGVNLAVAPGGSLAIVGESGSGKTTVARMLVGLTKPTAGTIVACGRDRSAPARA